MRLCSKRMVSKNPSPYRKARLVRTSRRSSDSSMNFPFEQITILKRFDVFQQITVLLHLNSTNTRSIRAKHITVAISNHNTRVFVELIFRTSAFNPQTCGFARKRVAYIWMMNRVEEFKYFNIILFALRLEKIVNAIYFFFAV